MGGSHANFLKFDPSVVKLVKENPLENHNHSIEHSILNAQHHNHTHPKKRKESGTTEFNAKFLVKNKLLASQNHPKNKKTVQIEQDGTGKDVPLPNIFENKADPCKKQMQDQNEFENFTMTRKLISTF